MYITVDIGGTYIRVAGVTNLMRPEFKEILRQVNSTYNEDNQFIGAAIQKIGAGKTIWAIGIGIPGTLLPDKSGIITAPNKPEWSGKPFVSALTSSFECPVLVGNDAVAASLGEYYYGENSGSELCYLVWGTGIGGAQVHKAVSGPVATKFNWTQYFQDWEMDCGGRRLIERFHKSPEAFSEEEWSVVKKAFTGHLRHFVLKVQPKSVVFGGGFAVHHTDVILQGANDVGIAASVSQFADAAGLYGALGLIRQGIIIP